MKVSKQELKPIWLHCIKYLFDEADRNNQTYIEISSLNLHHIAKEKFPNNNYNRFRSICYAMKSIFVTGYDEEISGIFNSSTYTIKYKLPRKEIFEKKDISFMKNSIQKTSVGSEIFNNHILKNISQPTIELLSEYLIQWKELPKYPEQENALNLLFQTYPNNNNLSEILLKCSVLNDFYSTNIRHIFIIAKHIYKCNIDTRLISGNPQLVNEISKDHGIKKGKTGKELHLFSFATKYCSFHNPDNFPICDRYVEKVLFYFQNKDKFSDFTKENIHDYPIFKQIIIDFRNKYNLQDFSFKQIDKYLWQIGKATFGKPK
jgi:hypothetical protein